jgi:hypothetical protein
VVIDEPIDRVFGLLDPNSELRVVIDEPIDRVSSAFHFKL